MSVKPFLLLLLLSGSLSALAQRGTGRDTVLKGSTIEVIQAYKPQIKQAPKPEWIPQLPPADTTHPLFNYEVPQQTLYYTYSSLPLHPLALGKDMGKLPLPNYVKIGGGNLSTIYLDAGVAAFNGANYETDIHLHHISQSGHINNQRSASSGVEADGFLHQKTTDLHAAIAVERNQYSLYGGDLTLNLLPDSIKQVYTTISAVVDLKNKQDSSIRFTYHPSINVSEYVSRQNAAETTLGFNAPINYKVSPTFDLQAALLGAYTSYTAYNYNQDNNFIELLPGVNLHEEKFGGHALFGFALGKNSKGYFLPDILASYKIPGTGFVISAGWQSLLRRNTYEQLTNENPYLQSLDSIRQTKTSELFVDAKASVGDHLSFSARLSYNDFKELPTYLNDITGMKQFYIRYQDVQAVSVKVGARYHVANILSVGATGDIYAFYGSAEARVWQQPNLRIKGDVMVMPIRKLTVTAYLALLGGIYARDISHNEVKMNPIADIGANAEYQIIPRLSAFAQVSNILNSKYERWYGYQSYGLNIYGGIRLKF